MDKEQIVFGIVGNPVGHSLSPFMHNAAFKELGLKAVYKLFEVPEEGLENFFKKLREDDSLIQGLNITVPYKEKAITFLDNVTPFAQKAMAVNVVVISEGRKLVGYNTDGPGFLAHLAQLNFNIQGKKIVILGAGGSARGILTALMLLPERPQYIRIYNRTLERLDDLIADLSMRLDVSILKSVMSIDDLEIERADLLINTTSVGMKKGDPVLVDENLLHKKMLVYDIIYSPLKTTLLKLAEGKGAKISNGLGMLFYQGVLSLQHWINRPLEEKIKKKMWQNLEAHAR